MLFSPLIREASFLQCMMVNTDTPLASLQRVSDWGCQALNGTSGAMILPARFRGHYGRGSKETTVARGQEGLLRGWT